MLETKLSFQNTVEHYSHFDFETFFFLILLNFEFWYAREGWCELLTSFLLLYVYGGDDYLVNLKVVITYQLSLTCSLVSSSVSCRKGCTFLLYYLQSVWRNSTRNFSSCCLPFCRIDRIDLYALKLMQCMSLLSVVVFIWLSPAFS